MPRSRSLSSHHDGLHLISKLVAPEAQYTSEKTLIGESAGISGHRHEENIIGIVMNGVLGSIRILMHVWYLQLRLIKKYIFAVRNVIKPPTLKQVYIGTEDGIQILSYTASMQITQR